MVQIWKAFMEWIMPDDQLHTALSDSHVLSCCTLHVSSYIRGLGQ